VEFFEEGELIVCIQEKALSLVPEADKDLVIDLYHEAL